MSKSEWRDHILSAHVGAPGFEVSRFELGIGWHEPETFHANTFPDCPWQPTAKPDEQPDLWRGLLAFDSSFRIGPGASCEISVIPRHVLRAERFMVPSKLAHRFEIESIRIGPIEQLMATAACVAFATEFPIRLLDLLQKAMDTPGVPLPLPFGFPKFGCAVMLSTVAPAQCFAMTVKNIGKNPERFVAGVDVVVAS